jgi:hypothetical protein
MDMLTISGYVAAVVAALWAFGFVTSYASAKGTNSTDVSIQLRVAGDPEALRPIRFCLAEKLSQLPDVKVAAAATDGTRFIVDIVAAKKRHQEIRKPRGSGELSFGAIPTSLQGRRGCGSSIDEHPILYAASAARGRSGPVL